MHWPSGQKVKGQILTTGLEFLTFVMGMGRDAEQHECACWYDRNFSTCSVFLSRGTKTYIRPAHVALHISVVVFVMSLPPDLVREGIMFSGCPFICSFIHPPGEITCEWLEQSWWNLQGIFTSPYWWPGGQRSQQAVKLCNVFHCSYSWYFANQLLAANTS